MTTIRAFTVITILGAALVTRSAAFAEPPAKAPDKTAKEAISEADAEKFVAFFDKLVAIAVANKEDCAKMAAGFNAHIEANQALLKEAHAAKSAGRQLPASAKEKIEKKTKEEFVPAISKKCSTDKTVQAALMRMAPDRKPMKDADKK